MLPPDGWRTRLPDPTPAAAPPEAQSAAELQTEVGVQLRRRLQGLRLRLPYQVRVTRPPAPPPLLEPGGVEQHPPADRKQQVGRLAGRDAHPVELAHELFEPPGRLEQPRRRLLPVCPGRCPQQLTPLGQDRLQTNEHEPVELRSEPMALLLLPARRAHGGRERRGGGRRRSRRGNGPGLRRRAAPACPAQTDKHKSPDGQCLTGHGLVSMWIPCWLLINQPNEGFIRFMY